MLALLAFALAQDPASAPVSAARSEESFDYEIVVYGEPALRQARWDAIIALKRLGWEPVDKAGGWTVFKPPRRWMGRARLDPDGDLTFGYPVVAFQKAQLVESTSIEANPNLSRDIAGNVVDVGGKNVSTLPAGSAGFWVLPSRAVLDAAYARVREAVRPELDQYARIRRDTAIRAELDVLPDQLDALWNDGIPLVGSTPVESEKARKAAVLGFWATRADTFEGRQVTKATEAWIRNTLVDAHAITDAEREKAESLRQDGRKLP
ncbi:MAG: hypothetical protein H6737_04165 [Alphaproteobacteria bacterium]|nr:hypothetical protein [Alphaproteobacteria bacterium]